MELEEKARRAALGCVVAENVRNRKGRQKQDARRDEGPRRDGRKRSDSVPRCGNSCHGEKPRSAGAPCGANRPRADDESCAVGEFHGADRPPLTIASGTAGRLRGLLLTRPHDEMLLLVPCGDVHTAGMRRRLDIAFVDDAGRVIEAHRDVGPMRRLRNRRAAAVLERFSSCSSPWFSEGDQLGVVRIGEVEA